MKLILLADVENLGAAGDIVDVKPGYGRNYLLPRGFAMMATPGAEKNIAEIKRAQAERAVRDAEHARELRTQIEELKNITVKMRSSASGKLFGSVRADDIVAAVEAAGGPKLSKHALTVPKGLVRKVGGYQVIAQLHDKITVKVNFKVVAA